MKKQTKKTDYKKLTTVIILIGILLRFVLMLFNSVSGDACWQLSASRFISENKKFPLFEPLGRQEPFWPPPLFHMAAALMYSLFGIYGANAAELGMKMLSPIFGSLTLIFSYLINKKLFDEKITFYSMFFTSFIPIFIDYHVYSYIDGALTFFVVLSIYFALEGSFVKSSIAAGLAALTKYNGIFVLPIIIYIAFKNTKDKKALIKRIGLIFLIPLLIASPWLARNYSSFGNPFWPFMNFIFHGVGTSEFESANLQAFSMGKIFNINSVTFTYLAIFGVPDGNYKAIFFFNIPYIKILFAIWLAATLFFILPFTKSFSRKEKEKTGFLWVWIFSYALVLLIYIGNVGWTATRFFIPAIPALGMLYGIGVSSINFRNRMLNKLFLLAIFVIVAGFVAAESAKVVLASNEWKKYDADFKWIKNNTGKNAMLIPGDQCLAYYTHRGTLKPTPENLKKADYVFANRDFILERRSAISNELLKETEKDNFARVYYNPATGTKIYKVRQ